MRFGDEPVKRYDRSTLRILGTVGEPINPEAWRWYFEVIGESRCPIVDTWWQTETGGHMITPLPGLWDAKPGSATLPFFGVQPCVIDPETKKEFPAGPCSGHLCIKAPWPSTTRTIMGDHQ
jgi:acetyl-CoA synthetase